MREVGLDAAHIDGALARLETRHKTEARTLGLRRHVIVERLVTGGLDPERLARASKLANRSVGTIGRSEIDAGGLSWFGRHVNVSITERGGQLLVQIEERFHNTARGRLGAGAMLSMMAALACLVSLANVGLEPLGLLLFPLFPLLTYLGLRAHHAATIDATQSRLENLGDQLAQLVAADEASPAS